MVLSQAGRAKWLLQLPRIEGGPFTGTGDLAAAMVLAWTQLHPLEAPAALEKAGAVLQAVIRTTVGLDGKQIIGGKTVPPELRIIESKRAIEEPPVCIRCRLVVPMEIRGVIFDMDGTLTLPDQLDFKLMRERAGVPGGVDIVPYLREKHAGDEEAMAKAMAIIDEMERSAFSPPKLQPGLKESILQLAARGVRMGIVTRNSAACVDEFLRYTELPAGTFSPVITRDSDLPNKPDPAPVLHCCEAWGIEPKSALMVGDGVDDMKMGAAAGSPTVAMLRAGTGAPNKGDPNLPASFLASAVEAADAAAIKDGALARAADHTVSSIPSLLRFFPVEGEEPDNR
eukprot:gnl/TRDRNA2_/TRDRNA2_62439_c1_seq1.p1 gnl/TRDRNA2_/TRDRNA2_62439_c1~~gnl/TRDRNA2_/TRDRNA2_62439_c1_seq1.p1  ORF type:complete len:388 (-),score=87.30 gnl/TRDRNA2_/TRDRNA2_62439_c1_seq1:54-1076(-)